MYYLDEWTNKAADQTPDVDGWGEVDDLDIGSVVDSEPEETKQLDPLLVIDKDSNLKRDAEGWDNESNPKVDVEGWDDPDLVLDDSDIDL